MISILVRPCGPSGEVVAGGLVVGHPHDHDVVQRGAGLPVAGPAESVTVGLAGGRRDRAGPG
jgi:hypothetical protein